jgi:hypothetical protein
LAKCNPFALEMPLFTTFQGKIALYRTKNAYELIAVTGIVMIQAVTMVRMIPHWTADDPRVAPTPMIAPVIA